MYVGNVYVVQVGTEARSWHLVSFSITLLLASFFLIFFTFMCMCKCLHVYGYQVHVWRPLRSELHARVIVNHHVLGTKPQSSVRTASSLNLGASCPAPSLPYFFETGVSPNLQLIVQLKLAIPKLKSRKPQRSPPSSPPSSQCWDLRSMHKALGPPLWMAPSTILKHTPGKSHSDRVRYAEGRGRVSVILQVPHMKERASDKCWL